MSNEISNTMAKIYRHIFVGGTVDQINHDRITILILNPAVKNGTVKRKSAGRLYDRTIVYMNTLTGMAEVRTPESWGNIDPEEIKNALDRVGQSKLT